MAVLAVRTFRFGRERHNRDQISSWRSQIQDQTVSNLEASPVANSNAALLSAATSGPTPPDLVVAIGDVTNTVPDNLASPWVPADTHTTDGAPFRYARYLGVPHPSDVGVWQTTLGAGPTCWNCRGTPFEHSSKLKPPGQTRRSAPYQRCLKSPQDIRYFGCRLPRHAGNDSDKSALPRTMAPISQ